jgi:uncharacterized membrane protein
MIGQRDVVLMAGLLVKGDYGVHKIYESIEIAAPIEAVFEFVADFKNALRWMYGFNHFEPLTKQSKGKGARVKAAGKLSGIPVTTELEITEFKPNQKLVSASTSGLKSVSAWLFEPTEKGTRVSFVGYYEPPHGALGGILSNVWLRRELAEHTWKSLKTLKRTMEAAYGGAGATWEKRAG